LFAALHLTIEENQVSVDERSRHELYLSMEELIGSERAGTLMSMLPPVGWADVATKHDLRELEERLELRLEAKLERSLRELTTRLTFALIAALATMTTLNLTAVAFLR
jgi:hypothetical protein